MTRKKQKPAASEPARPKWPADMMWPLSRVLPYERNPRTHPPAQIVLLSQLLLKHGPDQPIVVDEDGIILKGHGRRLAALAAGMEDFPVVQRAGMTEADKTAMRIADNQVALLSGWDKELIRHDIGDLKNSGYDVALLGFGDQQLVQFMTTPGPPDGFATFDETIPTKFCCPKCAYRWSGNPLAGEDPGEVKAAKKKK